MQRAVGLALVAQLQMAISALPADLRSPHSRGLGGAHVVPNALEISVRPVALKSLPTSGFVPSAGIKT